MRDASNRGNRSKVLNECTLGKSRTTIDYYTNKNFEKRIQITNSTGIMFYRESLANIRITKNRSAPTVSILKNFLSRGKSKDTSAMCCTRTGEILSLQWP